MQTLFLNCFVISLTSFALMLMINRTIDKVRQAVFDRRLQQMILKKLEDQPVEEIMKLLGGKE